MVVKICLFIFLSVCSLIASAENESAKAIVKASKEDGIILSEIAKKNIGFGTSRLVGTSPYKISRSSLVYSRDIIGIYLVRDQWIKMVPIKVLSMDSNYAIVESNLLKDSAEIVSSGVPLVRVSEMEAFSTAE